MNNNLPPSTLTNADGTPYAADGNTEIHQLIAGCIVHFVEETPNEYGTYDHKAALIQHVYLAKNFVHLRIFEAYPQDDHAADAHYSREHQPGTWHWIEQA